MVARVFRPGQILVTDVPERNFDFAKALSDAARARQVSAMRLAVEIIRLSRGKQGLSRQEYFLYGVHRAHLTKADRQEFVGEGVASRINGRLAPQGPENLGGLFTDKVLTDLVLGAGGLPRARIRALAMPFRPSLPFRVLNGAAEIAGFLTEPGTVPLFAKPVHMSRSVGAISILERAGQMLRLGDGREVAAGVLAAEIDALYPDGYLFQELMLPHPQLAAIIGPVIGSVRIVTLRLGGAIRPLYALIKMPGAGQMVDDVASYLNTMAAVDVQTGRLIRAQDARRLGGTAMPVNPVTGATIAGAELPDWPAAVDLALKVHALFPRQGILGPDIALTPDGPKITEVNSNPSHGFYQKCHARGLMNKEIAPQILAALAEFGHKLPTKELRYP